MCRFESLPRPILSNDVSSVIVVFDGNVSEKNIYIVHVGLVYFFTHITPMTKKWRENSSHLGVI